MVPPAPTSPPAPMVPPAPTVALVVLEVAAPVAPPPPVPVSECVTLPPHAANKNAPNADAMPIVFIVLPGSRGASECVTGGCRLDGPARTAPRARALRSRFRGEGARRFAARSLRARGCPPETGGRTHRGGAG